ncbi:MAG: hypothetical protein HGB11_07190 [Chlorobiales bacterium]|nr:hypothetical protein [Chlorobiales bacterium]
MSRTETIQVGDKGGVGDDCRSDCVWLRHRFTGRFPVETGEGDAAGLAERDDPSSVDGCAFI